MTVEELLSDLARRGVQVWAEDDKLNLRAPKGTLTPELRDALSERKSEILASLQEADRRAREFPLSYGQRTFWFYHQMTPTSAAYNIMHAAHVRSDLDVEALRRAFQGLVDRHAPLRTVFGSRDGEPYQRVERRQPVSFEVVDAADWAWERLDARLQELADGPFDLERGPLMRIHLFTRAPREHVLLLTVHHMAVDFVALGVLGNELPALYEHECRGGGPSPLPAPAAVYKDFVHWQRAMVDGPEGQSQWDFWREKLSGERPVLDLPTDRPRPPVQTYRGAARDFGLGDDLTARIRNLARTEGVTPYVVVLAAFQLLLRHYSGQDDVLVGSPALGRSRPEHEQIFGTFVNPIVLRGEMGDNPPLRDYLRRVRQTVLEAVQHQDFPFPLLVERLQPTRDPSRSPLFQVALVWDKPRRHDGDQDSLLNRGERTEPGKLELEFFELEQRGAPFDLTLTFFEMGTAFEATLRYNVDLFDAPTIDRMTGHLRALLEGMVANPERRLLEIPWMSDAERERFLAVGAGPGLSLPVPCLLHEQVSAQARRTPGAVAVSGDRGDSLTYAELDRKSSQLAHRLRAEGVGPDVLVGVCLSRTPELLVGLLGILKAGGAYLPLDPDYPADRLAYLVGDAAAPVVVSQTSLLDRLPRSEARVVCLDAEADALAALPTDAPVVPGLTSEHLAYVIYTSGSTGRPKGVQISHRAVVNFLLSMKDEPGMTADDTLLAVTSLSFDIAGLELFLPLIAGARIAIVERDVAIDGLRLAARLRDTSITIVQATPSTWRLLLAAGWRGGPHLTILCGGEPMTRTLADQLLPRCGALWNMYGPTETTIWSTIDRVTAEEATITIGRPIANTQAYVLDAELRPVPVGASGALYLGGDGLARGYHNRAELTSRQFVPNPFASVAGDRLYNTGDVARLRADGRFEVLGRRDHQVKIRGVRIDLGEIETVLARHPNVRSNVVVAVDEEGGEKRLVAYVVPRSPEANGHSANGNGVAKNGACHAEADSGLSVDQLRRFLKETLPEALIPSAFIVLDAMPLTTAGKIDRAALPKPGPARPELEASYVAPRDSIEERLAEIFARILGVSRVGVHDNFFALGGASLQGLQIVTEAQAVGLPLSPELLFEHQTVAELAARCSALMDRTDVAVPAAPVVDASLYAHP